MNLMVPGSVAPRVLEYRNQRGCNVIPDPGTLRASGEGLPVGPCTILMRFGGEGARS